MLCPLLVVSVFLWISLKYNRVQTNATISQFASINMGECLWLARLHWISGCFPKNTTKSWKVHGYESCNQHISFDLSIRIGLSCLSPRLCLSCDGSHTMAAWNSFDEETFSIYKLWRDMERPEQLQRPDAVLPKSNSARDRRELLVWNTWESLKWKTWVHLVSQRRDTVCWSTHSRSFLPSHSKVWDWGLLKHINVDIMRPSQASIISGNCDHSDFSTRRDRTPGKPTPIWRDRKTTPCCCAATAIRTSASLSTRPASFRCRINSAWHREPMFGAGLGSLDHLELQSLCPDWVLWVLSIPTHLSSRFLYWGPFSRPG